jgi:hypothetical protein
MTSKFEQAVRNAIQPIVTHVEVYHHQDCPKPIDWEKLTREFMCAFYRQLTSPAYNQEVDKQ